MLINETSWDKKVLGINTFEIIASSEEMLFLSINQIKNDAKKGHYSVKVHPLWNTKILSDYDFYYCDTLIQPYCSPTSFIPHHHTSLRLSQQNSLEELVNICNGAFTHGRFHRDFNIDKQQADLRYNSWLSELFNEKKVWGLMYDQELAGFWCFSCQSILLHALKASYRGKGMAKYFWSIACPRFW